MLAIVPLTDIEPQAVDALLDRAFGTDRRERTAYQVRIGTSAIPTLSFATIEDNRLVGTIQCWPVRLACDDGADVPMVMVGPVAVEPERQHEGLGRALMTHMTDRAVASGVAGIDAMMLIGDPEYYDRFFGFSAARTGAWRLPGPFEARRLLARGTAVPDRAGVVGPRVDVTV